MSILNKLNCRGGKGYLLLETSAVLAVLAVAGIAGLYKVNQKIENDIVDSMVERFSTVAEKAYDCWDIRLCKHDNPDVGGWNTDPTFDYSTQVFVDGDDSFKPFKVALGDKDANNSVANLVITTSGVRSDIGQRVVRQIGSHAQYKPTGTTADNSDIGDIEFRVGVPGTEFAFRGSIKESVKKIEAQDLEFSINDAVEWDPFAGARVETNPRFKNISGVENVDMQTITIDGIRVDRNMASTVQSLRGKECIYGVIFRNGDFECVVPDNIRHFDNSKPRTSCKEGYKYYSAVLGRSLSSELWTYKCYRPDEDPDGGCSRNYKRRRWGNSKHYVSYWRPRMVRTGPVAGHGQYTNVMCNSEGYWEEKKITTKVPCNNAYYLNRSCGRKCERGC